MDSAFGELCKNRFPIKSFPVVSSPKVYKVPFFSAEVDTEVAIVRVGAGGVFFLLLKDLTGEFSHFGRKVYAK